MGCGRSWNLRILLIAAGLFGFGVSSAFPQMYAGLELGVGKHELHDTYNYWPGIQFFDGSGYSFAPWLLLESTIDTNWSVGFNTGLDFKQAITKKSSIDRATVAQTPPYPWKPYPTWNWSTDGSHAMITYVRFNPYIRYSVLPSVFVRVGPGIMYRVDDMYDATFESDSAGIRATNTPSDRLIDNRKVRMSAVFSAGYSWQFHQLVIEPIVTYEQPFTSLQEYSGLTLTSFYFTVVFKIRL